MPVAKLGVSCLRVNEPECRWRIGRLNTTRTRTRTRQRATEGEAYVVHEGRRAVLEVLVSWLRVERFGFVPFFPRGYPGSFVRPPPPPLNLCERHTTMDIHTNVLGRVGFFRFRFMILS